MTNSTMEKDEIIRQRQANFRQTNAYAMQNGLILGVWSIGCLACFVGGITTPLLNTLWLFMFLGIPVVTFLLTLRFRRIVGLDVNFTFSRGFLHALLTLFYASMWAGVATFIYMQYFDNGFIFDAMAKAAADPEFIKNMEAAGMQEQLDQLGKGTTLLDVINQMRVVGAGNYAALIIYTYIFTAPIISLFVGLFSIHRVHYKRQ